MLLLAKRISIQMQNQNWLRLKRDSTSSQSSLESSMVSLPTSPVHAMLVWFHSFSLSSECSTTYRSMFLPILWSLTSQWTTSLRRPTWCLLTAISHISSTKSKNTLNTKTGSSMCLSQEESAVWWSQISGHTMVALDKERAAAMDLWLANAQAISPHSWLILFSDCFNS